MLKTVDQINDNSKRRGSTADQIDQHFNKLVEDLKTMEIQDRINFNAHSKLMRADTEFKSDYFRKV